MIDSSGSGERVVYDWPTIKGLTRSLAIYYGVPFRGRRMASFYSRFLGPDSLYFDIGAHVGHRVRAAAKTGARVVAVEPQPAFFSLLNRLYGGNDRITILDTALGATEGHLPMRVSRAHPTVSTVNPGWIEQVHGEPGFRDVSWDRTVEVPVTTLDHLIETHGLPTYCKIDVEGHEAAVLSGTRTGLPHVSFEALPAAPEAAAQCFEMLRSLGDYRFNLVRREVPAFVLDDWCDATAIIGHLEHEAGHADVHARLVTLPPL